MESEPNPGPRRTSPAMAIFHFFSSLKLATVILVFLFLLTWFATLEQTVTGLRPMMLKYFNWKDLFFFPEIGKPFSVGTPEKVKVYFPMPSGFWLCVLFTINLTLGGLVRLKKTARKIPVLVSHFSVVFLMISAGVTHFLEERGAMSVYEGETSNFARDYHEQTIEIAELADGKVKKVHVIEGKPLTKLERDQKRVFVLKNLPFNLEVSGYTENAQPRPASVFPPGSGEEVVDGFWLADLGEMQETELYQAGCVARVLDKSGKAAGDKVLLSSSDFQPATVTFEGRPYLVDLRKKVWVLPYEVKLEDFRVERDPGTSRAATYESDVVKIDGERREAVLIKMNEPMRRDGFTLFQTNWGPQDQENPQRYYTVLEVVRNPADHWPLVALIFVFVGLAWQFGASLYRYLDRNLKKKSA